MRVDEQPQAPSRQTHLAAWVPRLLRLYPRAWRKRYADEVAAVLAEHRVTYWTALDLVLGAFDAHLHGDLLPGRLLSMAHRIRSSEIAVFCAFTLFCVAWLALRFVRDPLPIWEAAAEVHPELLRALTLMDLASGGATLAVLVGGLPVLVSSLAQAVAMRRWGLLALFAAPLLAAAALAVVALADISWSSTSQSGAVRMLQPIAVQIGLILLPLVAVGGSAAAVAVAVGHSELDERLLRFALVPAGVATAGLGLGLLGAIALNVLIFAEAPQVSLGAPVQAADLLTMLAAVVLSSVALRHGIHAARGAE